MSGTNGHVKNRFCAKMREGNLSLHTYLSFVNLILEQAKGRLDRDGHALLSRALRQAYALKPLDSSIIELLLRLLPAGNDDAYAEKLRRERMYVKKHVTSDGKKKIALGYLEKFDYARALDCFMDALTQNSRDIDTLLYIYEICIHEGKLDELQAVLDNAAESFGPDNPYCFFFLGKQGELAFVQNDLERAEHMLEQSQGRGMNTVFANLLAETRLRLGKKRQALEAWEQSLGMDGFQVPVYLKMYDAVSGQDNGAVENLSDCAINILMYTYNKLDMFRQTLERLAGTELGAARILLLENSCTDGTRDYLTSVQDLFPNNTVKVINLPTNIGAPAARNWLLAQPENRSCDFIAYLDDDVILQNDWLKRLAGTLKKFPRAAVAGTKVVNQYRPKTIQYIYRFFDEIADDKLRLSSHHANDLDVGQFDFVRQCLSVMGCCHLFRADALLEVGEFDVRFSPSQVDDIDHDVLAAAKGYEIVYNGFIETIHCQKSGKDAFKNRAAWGNVRGNDFKFAMKHYTRDMLELKAITETRDTQYVKSKIRELRTAGYLTTVPEVPIGIIEN